MDTAQNHGHSLGDDQDTPLKRRRITRACDRCNKGGIKCAPSLDPMVCAPCSAFGTTCTYDRPIKRRGPPAKTRGDRLSLPSEVTQLHHVLKAEGVLQNESWTYYDVAEQEVIDSLVDIYRQICYPIQPYYHWPTFRSQVAQLRYRHDRSFCATVMAVCAMSAARLRDGAQPNYALLPDMSLPSHVHLMSEEFYEASIRAIPTDLTQALDFNYKRAKAILSLLSVQYGHTKTMCHHLGDYMTMCSVDGFHQESRWPQGLNAIEVQERRRLYWQMYQLDVYAAVTFNGLIRHRESQCTVLYPAEVRDEEITPTGIVPLPSVVSQSVPWLRGWNFVVDLYRILEHAVERLRVKGQGAADGTEVTALFAKNTGPTTAEIMDVVESLYNALPDVFKGAKAMTGDVEEDIYGFQAVNIIITLQTVKMVVAGSENSNVSQKCMIAGQLLDALASIPTAYMHASSAPMMHHLAGVGHLLGSVIQSPLSQWTYLQVRNVLLAMVDLLASLESVLSSTEGGSARLKAHVARIDQYMTNAAIERQKGAIWHSSLPREAWDNAQAINSSSSTGIAPADNSEPLRSTYTQAAIAVPPPQQQTINDAQQPQWEPATNIPPQTQFQLPDSLFNDWPFDIGQREAFDFLGDLQSQGQGSATNDTGNTQEALLAGRDNENLHSQPFTIEGLDVGAMFGASESASATTRRD